MDTYIPGAPAGNIGNSRHNLGSFGMHVGTMSWQYGTTEICTFCHTPHFTNVGANFAYGLGPMWNRGSSAPTSFTAYGATIGGTTIANTDVGSTTLACLSCHDGVTTFDTLANAPGKGRIVQGGSDRGFAFYDFVGSVPVADYMTSARLVIGLNLTDDHPVSVVYNENVAGLRPTNTVISSIDLTSELNSSATTYDNGNLTKNLWSVRGFISDTATIQNLLRGPYGAPGNRVECGSCHDPHFNNKSWQEIDSTYTSVTAQQEGLTNGQFLRRVGGNTGSGVCRTCHEK
ncbi:MAG: hypothetical protein HY954_10125 [Deltaproteobacteria bacterium]|nr:hypothetical protein [Deltaproteobacteria bacterium]